MICRHLPALGESLATLVGAMPVAFLEPDLNAYNSLSVFNTKTPRERASQCPPHSPFIHHIPDIEMDSTDTVVFFNWFFFFSSKYARHSGGDVSGDTSLGQTPQRRQ